jgi:prevent-host-death family protein
MKENRYPVYEAKAKLSQAVREARAGFRVVLTVHGKDAVELVPVRKKSGRESSTKRIERLRREGAIRPPESTAKPLRDFPTLASRRGALGRFLKSRE